MSVSSGRLWLYIVQAVENALSQTDTQHSAYPQFSRIPILCRSSGKRGPMLGSSPQPFVLSDARESRARPVSLTTISGHAAHCLAVGGGRVVSRAAVERVVARPSARGSRSVSPEGHLYDRAYASSLASIVICAFSTFETGHPALALFAAVSKAC
jgi:hypothetical protein